MAYGHTVKEVVDSQTIELSVVTTAFRSAGTLTQFIDQTIKTILDCGIGSYEIIVVNDGSTDTDRELLLLMKQQIPELIVVELSRNFGHHPAFHAGLTVASGELIFLIDCDLEVPPECLTIFRDKLLLTGADAVYAYQEARSDALFNKLSGRIFWTAFNLLSDTPVPENLLTARLVTRRYLNALLSLRDANLFFAGLMHWVGFVQVGVPVKRLPRQEGSTYSLARRVALLTSAVTSFSAKPLVYLFFSGCGVTLLSGFVAATAIAYKLLNPGAILPGYTSLAVLGLFMTGTTSLSSGLVGIYVARVFRQCQNRPLYIIKDILR